MDKQIFDLNRGYSIDEITDTDTGCIIKLTSIRQPGISRYTGKKSGRWFWLMVGAIAAVMIAGLCVNAAGYNETAADPEAEKSVSYVVPVELTVAVQAKPVDYIPQPTDPIDSVEQVFPDDDPMEDEKITAALVEQGYFRADVPLSYIEQDYLHTACEEFGVDYHLMLGLIERENNFKNRMGDGGNAYGYCQIWPKWWSGLMEEIGAEDLNDPFDNFRTACAILVELEERHGSIGDALSAYNTNSPGPTEYASTVLANAEKWRWS